MTVAELIQKLQEFPAEMKVVARGFDEYGYKDLGTIETITISHNGNPLICDYDEPRNTDAVDYVGFPPEVLEQALLID